MSHNTQCLHIVPTPSHWCDCTASEPSRVRQHAISNRLRSRGRHKLIVFARIHCETASDPPRRKLPPTINARDAGTKCSPLFSAQKPVFQGVRNMGGGSDGCFVRQLLVFSRTPAFVFSPTERGPYIDLEGLGKIE